MTLLSERFADSTRLQSAAENQPPLRKGEVGEAVQILQQALIDIGFSMNISTSNGTQPPDGIYGDETVKTVYKFQSKNGLQCDGAAGKDTLHRLDSMFPKKQMVVDDILPPNPRLWSVRTCHSGDATPSSQGTSAIEFEPSFQFTDAAVGAASALPYDPKSLSWQMNGSGATAGANCNYADSQSRSLSTVLHLTNKYGGGYPPRDWAFDVSGSVEMVSGASLTGWNFGFTQVQTINNITFEYGGATPEGGSVRITVHEPPALLFKSQRDSRDDCSPWTKKAPQYTLSGSRIQCVTGDHPSCKTPNRLRNSKTRCDNFLWRILDSRKFHTIFTAQDPQGSFHAIGYFEWTLNQVATASWQHGEISIVLQKPGIFLPRQGKPWNNDGNSLLIATLGTISGNDALDQAIFTAVVVRPASNFAELERRLPAIPDNFYTD